MARILMNWELGHDLGHIVPLLSFAKAFKKAGHEVAFLLPDVYNAETLLAREGFTWFQSPLFRLLPGSDHFIKTLNFSNLLHNMGYNENGPPIGILKAWRNMFQLYNADVMVFDHSPNAILASRCLSVKRILLGTGFLVPPRIYPFPTLHKSLSNRQLKSDEDKVVKSINKCLHQMKQLPIKYLYELFDVDIRVLLTFPELDHYPERKKEDYWGITPLQTGVVPDWPNGSGKRIFAYLKFFDNLFYLLEALHKTDCSVVIYMRNVPKEIQNKYDCKNIKFNQKPLDMNHVSQEADAVICHAGHGTVASMLLAGKPMLLLPFHLEQMVTAKNIAKLGAGVIASMNKTGEMIEKLKLLLNDESLSENARLFANKYAAFDPNQTADRLVKLVEKQLM